MRLKFLVLLTFLITKTWAQHNFQKGYFIMPISPGQTTSLAGCFGDIRINHFHAGLDIRTGGQEGKNVYAAADGYISRIKIQNGGYGNSLYITHPNGLTTVYAHLKVFNIQIQDYIVQKQYASKSWEIDIEGINPDDLPVSQGNIIALSGNTGGSAGPHLHFEIRDQQENILDPAQFGFYELRDAVSPIIDQISLKCMSTDARIDGKFGLFNYTVIKGSNGQYALPKKIKAKGKIAVEILTYDRADKSPFRQGVSKVYLMQNQEKVFGFNLDKMSFENRLDMNVAVNYEKLIKQGKKILKCYVEPGNSFEFYETNNTAGVFEINETQNEMEIHVFDAFNNNANLYFNIEKDTSTANSSYENYRTETTLIGNFLKIDIGEQNKNETLIKLYKNEKVKTIAIENANPILYDLKLGLPTRITIGDNDIDCPANVTLDPNNPKIVFPNFKVDFKDALFAQSFVNFYANDEQLSLFSDIIPLKNPASVEWTNSSRNFNPVKYKIYLTGNKDKFIGGDWDGNKIKFNIKDLGTYILKNDEEAPFISARNISPNSLSFTINDRLSGIKSINCWVNNEWVLMNYEYKSGLIWSEKLDKTVPFSGEIKLEITDKCDNVSIYNAQIPSI